MPRQTYEVLDGNYTLGQLSKKTGVKLTTICKRLSRGRSIEEAISTERLPAHRTKYKHNLVYEGEVRSLYSLAKEKGVKYRTALDRYKAGKSIEAILNPMPKYALEYEGELKSLRQWGRELGISYYTLKYRYKADWTPAEILGYKARTEDGID